MGVLLDHVVPEVLRRDPEAHRRARLTLYLALVCLGLCVFYSFCFNAMAYGSASVSIVVTGVALAVVTPLALNLTRSIRVSGNLVALMAFAEVTHVILTSGGSSSPTMAWHVLAPLVATIVVGWRWGAVFTALALVEIGLILGAERSGWVFPTEYAPEMAAYFRLSMFGAVPVASFLLVLLSELAKQTALDQLQLSQHALAEEKRSVERQVEVAVARSEAERSALADCVRRLLPAMDGFARGDLTVRVEMEREGEMARLCAGFNQAVEAVSRTIAEVRSATEATAQAPLHITQATEAQAEPAREQSARADTMAAQVSAVSSTLSRNEEQARGAVSQGRSHGEAAKQGTQVLAEAMTKIDGLSVAMNDTARVVQELSRSGEEIGRVVALIGDIARQTNLLALNAAVEAAHAGHEGRGFAVVAAEVRHLAMEATQATATIRRAVEAVRGETAQAVRTTQGGLQLAAEGGALAARASAALDGVLTGLRSTVASVEQLASVGHDQARSGTILTRELASIPDLTQRSTAGITQVAASAEHLRTVTADLTDRVGSFRLSAGSLDARP